MKYAAVLPIVFLLCANPSLQIPHFINCSSNTMEMMKDDCGTVNCDGVRIMAVPCSLYKCTNTPMGHNEQNNSKPYPDCCPGPICAILG